MPFTVVSGVFRLVGRTPAGNPSGFSPDGDSVQFAPDDLALLRQLPVLDEPLDPTSVNSVQLRMEAIDALELHFQPQVKGATSTHQPRPLADQARDALTQRLALDPVGYRPPDLLRVKPPAVNDGARGWILTRSLDVHGRPVAFVFTGPLPPGVGDGDALVLDGPLLRSSANYAQLLAGNAYPLFYDTLFASLRAPLAAAARRAQRAQRGLWASDTSQTGVDASSVAALAQSGVVFPKLFRRLVEFFAHGNATLAGLLEFLAGKREQVLDLDTRNFTHFDNVLAVQGTTVRLTRPPARLVFVSDKGTQRPNQPQ
jgi:endonuclease YncB( thermonuclease family)